MHKGTIFNTNSKILYGKGETRQKDYKLQLPKGYNLHSFSENVIDYRNRANIKMYINSLFLKVAEFTRKNVH